jgi:hypothetical protein
MVVQEGEPVTDYTKLATEALERAEKPRRCCKRVLTVLGVVSPTTCPECEAVLVVRERRWVREDTDVPTLAHAVLELVEALVEIRAVAAHDDLDLLEMEPAARAIVARLRQEMEELRARVAQRTRHGNEDRERWFEKCASLEYQNTRLREALERVARTLGNTIATDPHVLRQEATAASDIARTAINNTGGGE